MIDSLMSRQMLSRIFILMLLFQPTSHSALPGFDRVKKKKDLRGLVVDKLFSPLLQLSFWRSIASLSLVYRYFHGKCFEELYSQVPPVDAFTAMIFHALYIRSNSIGKKSPFGQLLPKNSYNMEQTPDMMLA